MSPTCCPWTSTTAINAPLPAAAARPALGGTITILAAPPASTTPYWQHPPPGANRAAAPSPPATAGNPHRCHPAAYGMRHLTHSRRETVAFQIREDRRLPISLSVFGIPGLRRAHPARSVRRGGQGATLLVAP